MEPPRIITKRDRLYTLALHNVHERHHCAASGITSRTDAGGQMVRTPNVSGIPFSLVIWMFAPLVVGGI